ncbi:conserved Plasmodium protein, unknown function [Plasmodium malariae]|uniref:Uncharacterized protein n=1 Tax=Plasmodium malariae TaxID=5858 RepID=A0A1D3TEW3_PLAMA|nr:conserved Plasmodium protein, unknown function [Plasmodium malariae]SCP03438.1 conserved Plasmodium protein, unknown function [Plasmodium malariae]
MRVNFFIFIFITLLTYNPIFSYRRLTDLNSLKSIPQSLKPIKPTRFQQRRAHIEVTTAEKMKVDIGDWLINITYKIPSNNTEKIKSIDIYSMTFPNTELEEFKEYLLED